MCVPSFIFVWNSEGNISQARITNASEYTLLTGSASVYVDGSFISRSVVPAVSPQESFDCPLGCAASFLFSPTLYVNAHSPTA
jgi:hypothetical protein